MLLTVLHLQPRLDSFHRGGRYEHERARHSARLPHLQEGLWFILLLTALDYSTIHGISITHLFGANVMNRYHFDPAAHHAHSPTPSSAGARTVVKCGLTTL